MLKNLDARHIKGQKQVDNIAVFSPKVREILRGYRDKRQLSSIARRLGFHQSRLTEMITKNKNGEYKTRITPYYLARFIESNTMSVDQILEGRDLEDLPIKLKMFFERMLVPQNTLRMVIEAQRRGINIDRILEVLLYPEKDS